MRPTRAVVTFVVLSALAIGQAALPEPLATPARAQRASRPNVLVVVTDDQRAGTLNVMPAVRRWFLRGGRNYENAFATTPLCCPARASIFTGQYAHNHGVRRNREADALDQSTTVQRYLRQVGYRTAIFGKYLNSWPLSVDPPHFDRWAVMNGGYYGSRFNVDGRLRDVRAYSTRFVERRTVRFLRASEAHDSRPWLLYVTPFAPHGPFEPEARYRRARVPRWNRTPADRERDRSDKPPWVRHYDMPVAKARDIRTSQLRTLMSVDDLVGSVMRVLGRLGERDDTLAVYLSDNGYFWSEHGLWDKRLPYTEAVSIPLLLRWPGVVPAGSRDARLVANVDVAPTVLRAAGVTPQEPLDGRPLVGGGTRGRMFLEHFDDPFAPEWASTRTRRYQYVEYYSDAGTVTFREYYDLDEDPWQLRNLLGDQSLLNDPLPHEQLLLAHTLARDRRCRGTGALSGCP